MIDKKLFMNTVKQIRITYNRPDFLPNDESMNIWYEIFKDCKEWSFKKAVEQALRECTYISVPAEIYTRYKEYESYRLQQRNYFVTEWGNFCYDYPHGYQYKDDYDCQKKIMELTTDKCDGDYEEGLKLLEKYRGEMRRYLDKTDNPPDFKEYLMGLE